ncbi:MAG: gfo/Idh/MocA family oxidoreductase, partial [Caldithrix sp.]|nr:gfo/Idh/MocA family oxidoreductase [Caldithrix sp.]
MLKIGLIGLGGFGQFCLNTFKNMSDVQVTAISDNNLSLLKQTAKVYGIKYYDHAEALIREKQIDLVHIITPPFTHHTLSIDALKNGKHVLCEKPLALSKEQAKAMLQTARNSNRILPVNLVIRYVPLTIQLKQLIDQALLGAPLRAYFENYATDAPLPPNHWFWDKERSGGIFVEHGVHFFDLYNSWFGSGDVIWATRQKRPLTDQEDRVLAVMCYENGITVSHFHSFDQPPMLDRQRHHIVFEQGEVILEGWIPNILELYGLVDKQVERKLIEIFPGITIQ